MLMTPVSVDTLRAANKDGHSDLMLQQTKLAQL